MQDSCPPPEPPPSPRQLGGGGGSGAFDRARKELRCATSLVESVLDHAVHHDVRPRIPTPDLTT